MAVAAVNCENAINAQPQSTAFNARRFTENFEREENVMLCYLSDES